MQGNDSEPNKQTGMVLFISLIVLLVMSSMGMAGLDMLKTQSKISVNSRLKQLATTRAESALNQAGAQIIGYSRQVLSSKVSGKHLTLCPDQQVFINPSAVVGLGESWWSKNAIRLKNNKDAFYVIGKPRPVAVSRLKNAEAGPQAYRYVAYPVMARGRGENGNDAFLYASFLGVEN